MIDACGAAPAAPQVISTADTGPGEEEGGREGFEPARSRERRAAQSFPLSEVLSMTSTSVSVAAAAAAPLSVASNSATKAGAIARAAQASSSADRARSAHRCADVLRTAMESAFGASDADGGWDWKTAYDACEAATVLFVRKFGPAMRARAASPAAMLPMLAKIAGLLPTHTRRSEESEALQQFSTPIVLGLAASTAAAITPADIVLEPSAGTGLARDPGRAVGRVPRSQRARRNPRGASFASLSRHRRHPLRRRAHRRSSRSPASSRASC